MHPCSTVIAGKLYTAKSITLSAEHISFFTRLVKLLGVSLLAIGRGFQRTKIHLI